MGPRKAVVKAIEDCGDEVVLKNVRMDTNYLVIDDIGSAAWMCFHSWAKNRRGGEAEGTRSRDCHYLRGAFYGGFGSAIMITR